MAGMEHAPLIELSPNASWIFAPGRYHLMLLNPKRTLRADDRVDINLEFRLAIDSSCRREPILKLIR